MLSRASVGRNAARALRYGSQSVNKRGMAAAAPKGFEYETSEAAGVKVATRDLAGPTTTLTVVAKGGSRYQPFPGYADVLSKFAFKSTLNRSALRITRESELLGGELTSYQTKENLVLSARFLNADLPYYAELLAEVVSKSKYSPYELKEVIIGLLQHSQNAVAANPETLALESAHSVAFHHGLGNPLTPPPWAPVSKYVNAEGIASFAQGVYTKPSIAVVSSGADSAEVNKWVGQFFGSVPASSTSTPVASQASKYYGGEERIATPAGNAVVIAFPGSSAFGTAGYKPELSVLAALLGGQSSIKWSPGSSVLSQAVSAIPGVNVSTSQSSYSDAGLFHINITGRTADGIAQASKKVAEALNTVASGNVSSEAIKKASALAKFRALESGQNLTTGMEASGSGLIHGGSVLQIAEVGQGFDKVTEEQVKQAAKSLLSSKASVATIGDLNILPYAADIGLTV